MICCIVWIVYHCTALESTTDSSDSFDKIGLLPGRGQRVCDLKRGFDSKAPTLIDDDPPRRHDSFAFSRGFLWKN